MSKIIVYLEAQDDKLKRTSYEAVSAAKSLISTIGGEITGIILNGNEAMANSLGEYGLDKVINATHSLLTDYSSMAAASVLTQFDAAENADIYLFAGNAAGLELAPLFAAKINAGYVADCVGLEADAGDIIARKPVYAGKAQVKVKINTPKKVFSLRPNVFTAFKSDAPLTVQMSTFEPQLSEADFKVIIRSQVKNEGKLDVLEADIIVSGGRGIKGPENYSLVENLAQAFGAAVGASRAVVDAGWRPHSEQVGQTGKTVSPTLYVACGISGAVQHLAGMSSSKVIVAINKDKDAPIFKVADYGIVGDMFAVLPKLTEMIKSLTGR